MEDLAVTSSLYLCAAKARDCCERSNSLKQSLKTTPVPPTCRTDKKKLKQMFTKYNEINQVSLATDTSSSEHRKHEKL